MSETKRPRRTQQQWATLIDEYHQSGMRAPEYCQSKSLSLGTFRKWLYCRCEQTQPTGKKSGFSQVEIAPPNCGGRPPHLIEIHIDNGVQIACGSGVNLNTIAQLALAVRHVE